ncbi:hypothetical protein QQF64_003612 [Cirrhinus molitorella]|uniref:Uncharacterized protein n=1 Tax=Cirrhinus molitorella TaxID=172907 RepID=A0ABR3MLU1_9TELE
MFKHSEVYFPQQLHGSIVLCFPTLEGAVSTRFSSSADTRSSRRVQWRAPVIQATGRLRLADCLSSGVLGCSGLCRSGVRTKFGIDMVLLGEPGTTRSSKEG